MTEAPHETVERLAKNLVSTACCLEDCDLDSRAPDVRLAATILRALTAERDALRAKVEALLLNPPITHRYNYEAGFNDAVNMALALIDNPATPEKTAV